MPQSFPLVPDGQARPTSGVLLGPGLYILSPHAPTKRSLPHSTTCGQSLKGPQTAASPISRHHLKAKYKQEGRKPRRTHQPLPRPVLQAWPFLPVSQLDKTLCDVKDRLGFPAV